MSRCCSDGADSTFKHGHSVLEDRVGRITHASVDVTIFAPGELSSTVCGIGEVVGAGLIERNGTRPVYWIRLLTTMEGDRGEGWWPELQLLDSVSNGPGRSTHFVTFFSEPEMSLAMVTVDESSRSDEMIELGKVWILS